MIARTWHGRVVTDKADAYLNYLKRTGLHDFRATPGNMGVYVLRRDEGGITHYMVTTLWTSMDSVKSFAGDDPTKARYYPNVTAQQKHIASGRTRLTSDRATRTRVA